MKKFVFLLSGAMALTACSDNTFEEIDTQNAEAESMYSTNSFDDSNPGDLGTGGISNLATNYYSPWDIWFNRGTSNVDYQPSYVISNGIDEESSSPYTIRVYAWIGLAYFDGTNDGVFYDYSLGLSAPPVANMVASPFQYPNWLTFNAGQPQEVGNLVRTNNPLVFQPQEGARIEDREHHLPMPYTPGISLGTPVKPRYPSMTPPWASGFDAGGTLQPLEELLLRDYGKVFFYEVEVSEAGVYVGTYILHPEITTLPAGSTKNWHPVMDTPGGTQLQGNLPFGSFNLHYYTNLSSPPNPTVYNNTPGAPVACNSFELVFDAPGMYQYTITGSVPKTLTMDIWQDTPTFWRRSALALTVK